jgi:Histidine phosphatase superfamily (branch 1)
MIRALGVRIPNSRQSQYSSSKTLSSLTGAGGQERVHVGQCHRSNRMTSPLSTLKSTQRPGGPPSINAMTTLPPMPPNSHRVVMMRHGESEFNNANVFTGWCDIALTQRGVVEAIEAGQVFASHRMYFRKCYSSVLTRSIVTAQRSLEAAGVAPTPLHYDWRLNERHYGSLQGLSKERTAERLGRKRVMEWRRSYSARPPVMTELHPHYEIIYNDPRYRMLDHYAR